MACKLHLGFCRAGFMLMAVSVNLFLWGCSSVPTNSVNPSEIEYKEISAKEYCDRMAEPYGYSSLYSTTKGYVLSDTYIVSAETQNENGVLEAVLGIKGRGSNTAEVYGTDYFMEMDEIDPTYADRIDATQNDERFNGRYKFWVYGVEEGDWWNGYIKKVIVHNIEGVPTQEEIDAVAAADEA